MAKIDLLDQKWIDLVFEGKNEAYGAYKIRQNTSNRNNLAMLILLLGLAAIVGIYFAWGGIANAIAASEERNEGTEALEMVVEEQEEVEEEEEIVYDIQPEEEQVQQDQLMNSEKFTDYAMDDEAPQEVTKTQEETEKSDVAISSVNFDQGSDEGEQVLKQNQVVVEKVEEKEDDKIYEFHNIEQMPRFPGDPGDNSVLLQWLGKNTKYVGRLSNSTTELECNIYVYVNADNVEFNTSLCLPNVSDGVLSVSEYNIFYYGSTLGPCQFYTDVLDTKYVKPYICAPFGSNAFYVANTYSPSVFRNVTYFNYFDVNVNSLGGGTVVFNQLGTDGIIPESGGSVQLKYSSLMRDESNAYGYAFHSPGVFPYIERVDKNGSWRSEIKSYENQGDTQIRTHFLLKPSFDNTTYNIRFIPE